LAKQKCDPYSRGMGGKDDFIAEQFVPDESYKSQQRAMVQKLIASGLSRDEVAAMFAVPFDLIERDGTKDE
jgi:hypothetical protein